MVVIESLTKSEEDMISELPDALICEILCRISTKDVVKTSVLSKRWKNIWQQIPILDLDSEQFETLSGFLSFANSVFDLQRGLVIRKLSLYMSRWGHDDYNSFLNQWTHDDSPTMRNIQHLDIRSNALSRITCLRANVNKHKKFKIINSGFSAKADISFCGLCDHGLIHDVLTDVLWVRELVISSNTWKELLVGVACTKVVVSTVPSCLVSSLKFVEFRRPITGYETEMKLVKYFLKNSTILKKLTLRVSNCRMIKGKDAILGEIFATPKVSIDCEILVL
ncbi:unnamed protein product [Eruca vesicaria subsp. sativa]|uniref:F-box domain-containing protein n=1 Tax=Eruca vesicaria subsp. sativa TaxID=29727 RepID=A0ABC8L370_ERUVS|nr:unnamed protein product [Eruca vesicaria subsp. sativa]